MCYFASTVVLLLDAAKSLGSFYRAQKMRCMERRAKPANILIRKHPRDLFFHQQVFFEGLEAGFLLSFKTWPLEEVLVADTVTLLFGSLLL